MHFSTVVALLGLSAASTVLAMPASQIFARQGGCSSNSDCPAGDCCSQYGYCGSGSSYCGSSGGSGGGSGQGSCSSNSDCPTGQCCSQYGYCGSGSTYCGSSGGTGGSTGQTYTGEATVNPNPSGADGSCGDPFLDSQFKVAISNSFMQSQSPSPYCGKQITLTNTGPNGDNSVGGQGNTVTVTVDDTCMGCDEDHLDLSVAAWNQLTDNSAYSHVGITWSFVS